MYAGGVGFQDPKAIREGTSFTVRKDHDDLKWMLLVDYPHDRLDRWILSLSTFDYTVVYRPGLKNQVPDELYRCVKYVKDETEVEDGFVSLGTRC